MKILARQLTVDMYDCKNKELSDHKKILESLQKGMLEVGFTPMKTNQEVTGNNESIIFMLLAEGHVVIRTYPDLNYVACDLFICQEDSRPEKAIRVLRKLTKPEKLRMTYLKRGDFGTVKDVKPRIKIRIARLRKIRSKGAKVLKNVARRIKV